jgi:molybdopterin-guanine dinucleotide biosynthesis protein A
MRTLGVLLAGGAGRRLGAGVPKALARVGGRTLLERAARVLGGACDEVVVAAPRSLAPALAAALPGARLVVDLEDAVGPLAGLTAGLAAAPHREAIALGVDFPLMTTAALERLAERLRGDPGARAVVPAPGGVPQPLAAAYGLAARDALARALEAGERSVTRAVMTLDPVVLDDPALVELGGPEIWLNLNRPEDLAEAERRLAAAESRAR